MRISKRGKRRILVVVGVSMALLAALGVLIIRTGRTQDLRLDELRAEGMAAFEAGEYATALQRLSTVISRDRTDVEAMVTFADARAIVPTENNRHLLEAIGIYRAALDHAPDHVRAMEGLLRMYEGVGRRIEAMELSERLLRIDADHFGATQALAIIHLGDRRFERSGYYAQRLIALEPNDVRWRVLYLESLRGRDRPLEELLSVCERWDEGWEKDGRYRLVMAQMLAAAGFQSRAVLEAREAAERGAQDADVLRQMLSLLDALQLFEEASELLALSIERFPDEVWPHEAQVRRDWQLNRLDAASSLIDDIRTAGRTLSSELLKWEGLLHLMLGRVEPARIAIAELEVFARTATDAAQRDTARAWVLALNARLESDSADWRQTTDRYAQAVSMSPRDAVLNFLLGESYMASGETELAAAALEQAARSDPNWLAAQVAYAQSLLSIGQVDLALAISWDLLRRTQRPGMTAYMLFARAWLESGRPDESIGLSRGSGGGTLSLIEFLEFLSDSQPESVEVLELQMLAALRYGRDDVVERIVERMLNIETASASNLALLARLAFAAGSDRVDELLSRSRALHGETLEQKEAEAWILVEQDDAQGGRQILEEFVRSEAGEEVAGLRALAAFLSRIADPAATGVVRELLNKTDPTGSIADFVLRLDATWTDAALTNSAIAKLAEVIGDNSPRVVIARANEVIRHRRNDDAAIAAAQVSVSEILQRAPGSLPALLAMSDLALEGSRPDPDQAARLLERAVQHHPNRADLYLRLIPILQRQGNFTAAANYIEQLRSVASADPNVRRAEVDFWRAQGEFDRAAARLGELIGPAAGEEELLLHLAFLHRAGRFPEAEEIIRQLFMRPEISDAAVQLAAALYVDAGRFDEGMRLVMEATRNEEESAQLLQLGRFLQYAGRLEEALESFEAALKLDDSKSDVIEAMIGLRFARGEIAEAYQLARRGLAINPGSTSMQSALFITAMELGADDRAEALRLLETGASPEMRETLQLYGRLRQDGRFVASRSDLAEARQLTQRHPLFLPAWRLAIMAHVDAGDRVEAVRLARQAAGRLPQMAEPAEMAARLMAEEGRLEEAFDMARAWRERSRHQPFSADVFIAALLLDLDRPHAAADQLAAHTERILKESDQDPSVSIVLMHAMVRGGRLSEAHRIFTPKFQQDGIWATAWFESAARLDRSSFRRAIELISPSVEATPEGRFAIAAAWLTYGGRFGSESALEQARQLAEAFAAEHADQRVPGLMLQAQVAEAQSAFDRAISLYREVLAIDPDAVIALNNLSYRLTEIGSACAEAGRLAERAMELMPGVPEIMHTHALALLCLGDHAAAESTVRGALAIRPDAPEFHLALGLALAGRAQWDDARQALRRAEALEQGPPETMTSGRRNRLERLRGLLADRTAAVGR